MEIDTNKEYKIKEICEILSIPYNRNHPKLSLKKIEYRFELEQVSKQKFKIVRELTPEEKAEIRLYSDCKRLLEVAIYITLSEAQKEKGAVRGGMKDFFELFHITNEYYRYFTYDRLTDKKTNIIRKLELSESYDIGTANLILHQFTEDVNPILRKLVLSTFKKMEEESYILLNRYLMFGKIKNNIDENGYLRTDYENKEATKEETEQYLIAKRELMEEHGYNEWNSIPFFKKGEIENRACKKIGKDYAFYEYEVILNQEGLKRKVEKENLQNVLAELNYSIGHKIRTSNQGNLKTTKISVKEDCIDGLIIKK